MGPVFPSQAEEYRASEKRPQSELEWASGRSQKNTEGNSKVHYFTEEKGLPALVAWTSHLTSSPSPF